MMPNCNKKGCKKVAEVHFGKIDAGEKDGKARVKKGFATNPELARKVGKIGGKNSRRGVAK